MQASAVSEDLLRKTANAYLSDDFPLFFSCIHLPQRIETFIASRVIATEDDVRELFNAVREEFRRKNVTLIQRHCIQAEFIDANTIHATHETTLYAGETVVSNPYPCFSVIRRVDGAWRVADGQYAIPDDLKNQALALTPERRNQPDARA